MGIILTAPAEEAQVDYGSGPMMCDPQTGKYRRPRLFVLTLGYSCKSVGLLAWRSSARRWAELHEKAFRRLGGCPRVVVLDFVPENKIHYVPLSAMCPSSAKNDSTFAELGFADEQRVPSKVDIRHTTQGHRVGRTPSRKPALDMSPGIYPEIGARDFANPMPRCSGKYANPVRG